MARETKIGLLVGLGVIIFIGILVSDHLSISQRQGMAGLTQPADARAVVSHESLDREPPARRHEASAAEREAPLPDPQSSARREDPAPAEPRPAGRGHLPYPIYRIGGPQADAGHDVLVIGEPPAETDQAPSVAPTGDQVHHAQPGDTLSGIAQKYYGDRNYWRTIYQANRDKMDSPDVVRTGVRLVIPKRADRRAPAEHRTFPPSHEQPRRATGYRDYRIQPGDTLSQLAQRFMGSQRHTDDLYELNRDVIDDPDTLVVGKTLRVPAD